MSYRNESTRHLRININPIIITYHVIVDSSEYSVYLEHIMESILPYYVFNKKIEKTYTLNIFPVPREFISSLFQTRKWKKKYFDYSIVVTNAVT